jgi:8-amino-7-oxononanoate synthase
MKPQDGPPSDFLASLRRDLAELEGRGLRRALRPIDRAEGSRVVIDHRTLVNFASNDYLGLATNPRVRAAAANAILEQGWGAGASRLLSGTRAVHAEAERTLAAFRGAEAALLFPTGYAANLGLLQALADRDAVIVSDALNHASLIDACRLSRARVAVYPHRDVAAARRALEEAPGASRRFLVTDAVFSMDGDLAPLPELFAAARATGSVLVVDDAHGNGVLGAAGRGTLEELGVDPAAPDLVVTATLSKAFGGSGGFVAAAREVVDWLVTRARAFIYTTGIPPAAAAGAVAALEVMETDPWRRQDVRAHARRLRQRLAARRPELASAWSPESWDVPIVPVVVGPERRALAAADRLFAQGFFAPAIRPPTVPDGTARLRLSLSAEHLEADIEALATAVADALEA